MSTDQLRLSHVLMVNRVCNHSYNYILKLKYFCYNITDMNWITRGSGRHPNLHTGTGNVCGGHTKKVLDSHTFNRLCRKCDVAQKRVRNLNNTTA